MAAQPSTVPSVGLHEYYANAYVFEAKLQEPIADEIERKAPLKLPEGGGYKYMPAMPFRVEGVLSYASGYTQVAGYPSSKTRGFTTLATSVIVGLPMSSMILTTASR